MRKHQGKRPGVPMDEERETLVFELAISAGEPVSEEERAGCWASATRGAPAGDERAAGLETRANDGNDYFLDSDLSARKLFAASFPTRPGRPPCRRGMGPICDRTREHLDRTTP